MLERFLDKVGDWNPQLMRELKCRLTMPSIIATTLISLTIQLIIWGTFRPSLAADNDSLVVWGNMIEFLDRGIWLGLAIGGIYLLAKDFNRELSTGTLGLVSLSPISPRKIILGKLLGIPILLYWAVFLTIPFHLIVLQQSGAINLGFWAWKAIEIAIIFLLYLYAILSTLEFPLPPIILSLVLTIIGQASLIGAIDSFRDRSSTSIISGLSGYANLDLWRISISIVNFSITSFAILKLIESIYSAAKSWQERSRSVVVFLISSIILFTHLYLSVLLSPPMLVLMFVMWLLLKVTASERSQKS
jgi:hypothetical protein